MLHASFVSDASNVTEACRLSVLLRDYNMYVIKLKRPNQDFFFPRKGLLLMESGSSLDSTVDDDVFFSQEPVQSAQTGCVRCWIFHRYINMLNSITPTKGSSCGWLALRYRISQIHWHKAHKAETSFLLNLKQNSFDMLLPFMCKLKRVKKMS